MVDIPVFFGVLYSSTAGEKRHLVDFVGILYDCVAESYDEGGCPSAHPKCMVAS